MDNRTNKSCDNKRRGGLHKAKHWEPDGDQNGEGAKISSESKERKEITFVSTSTCSQSDEAQQAIGGRGREGDCDGARWRKMKDNNTYTGDGDDLDLVTLEKTNREGEKERERDLTRDQVDKNKKKKQKGKRKKKSLAREKSTASIISSHK